LILLDFLLEVIFKDFKALRNFCKSVGFIMEAKMEWEIRGRREIYHLVFVVIEIVFIEN